MKFKRIGLGNIALANFSRQDFVFADKTRYIGTLEDFESQTPVFLRPRRFGKTLFTKILFNYYDKSQAAKFDENFKGTWIYDHRTELASSYYCLKFDFSKVDSFGDGLIRSFIQAVASGISNFSKRYPEKGFSAEELDPRLYATPSELMNKFLTAFDRNAADGELLYIIIDEYDHFANDVLSKDRQSFRDLTSTAKDHPGPIKVFYRGLKSYAGGEDSDGSCIDRFFLTGVSAVSLDSVTSGFNISANISTDAEFNAMAGFTHDELSKIIDETVDFSRLGGITKAQILDVMEQRYDGYLFSAEATEKIFCPNMCLTFLHSLIKTRKIPPLLAAGTLTEDVGNLDGMLRIAEPWVRDELEDLIFRREKVRALLPQALNLNEHSLFNKGEAAAQLMYLGFLTFGADEGDDSGDMTSYRCPNEASYQVFLNCLQAQTGIDRGGQADLTGLEEYGDVRPLADAASLFIKRIDDRAFAGFNERTLQTVFYFTVKDSGIRSLKADIECDTGDHGRADLYIQNRRPGGRQLLLELKYLSKAKGTDQAVASKLEEAKAQLERYRKAPNFKDVQNLDCWAIVFVNAEPKAVEKLS